MPLVCVCFVRKLLAFLLLTSPKVYLVFLVGVCRGLLKVRRFALRKVHQSPSLSPHLVPQLPTFVHLLCTHCVRAHAHVITRTRALCAHASQRNSLSFLCDFVQGVHFFRKSFFGACVIKKPV